MQFKIQFRIVSTKYFFKKGEDEITLFQNRID